MAGWLILAKLSHGQTPANKFLREGQYQCNTPYAIIALAQFHSYTQPQTLRRKVIFSTHHVSMSVWMGVWIGPVHGRGQQLFGLQRTAR